MESTPRRTPRPFVQTRRSFVQTLGSLSALGGAASLIPWASAAAERTTQTAPGPLSPRFGYVASAQGAIHVFTIGRPGAWKLTQTVASAAPVSLALSPDQRFLYVANAVDRIHTLPAGSVESFAIDERTGALTPLNRQRLALSATTPRHLAVSPNGRLLAVAVAGGGAYNLLPLAGNGSIGPVTASLKQVGHGPCPRRQSQAAPHAVCFHHDDLVLGADLGSDRFSTFSVRDGHALQLEQHRPALAGSGPAHLAAHPGGDLVYLGGGLHPVLSSHRLGQAWQPERRLQLPGSSGLTALAVHPSGSLLFAADPDGLSVAQIDGLGGIDLASLHPVRDVVALAPSPDGAHLFALRGPAGTLTRLTIDHPAARLSSPLDVASVPSPLALTLKHRL